ncbi:beta-ketoacyl synthase-like protein [Dyadobacter jejuensis]|uniref:Beta-ketoacyl synthase-like protein n=1 Tax=Dyadobacter jejuensis TaxID=1082580 RepID=A0A316AL85_9BACT|nr:beta-ketoacyl synthase chain length factor [Dyadobacter jejuensis]PWJ58565.1 beta-ketoacyl synthase-like protein [Dyadobacter jejuensis]
MHYIKAASSITHQPSFQQKGFAADLSPLSVAGEVIAPNYKEYIEGALLRRMGKILRMSVAAAKDVILQADAGQPNSIVVGTGLGCLLETEKFLTNTLTLTGMLPPTAFIQSTHNTIAGQISLILENHGYNMTHTQNTLSFEHALIDARLLLDEGQELVLVGAADESIPFLEEVSRNLLTASLPVLTSGASFFMLDTRVAEATVAIIDVKVHFGAEDRGAIVFDFLKEHDLSYPAIDLLMTPLSMQQQGLDSFGKVFAGTRQHTYLDYSGLYPSASAFGFHMAIDMMQMDRRIGYTLIINNLSANSLGLILLKNCEA